MSSTEEIVEDSLTESRTESTEESKKVLFGHTKLNLALKAK